MDGSYFSYIAEGITGRGARVFFVTFDEPQRPAWMQQREAVVVYHSLGIRSRVFYPFAVWRLARFLRRHRIDILHTHLFDAAIVGLAAARLAGTPIKIVSRHHLDEAHLLGSHLHVALDKWTDRVADCVFVPSDATRHFMREVEGQTSTEIRVVPLGFDFDEISRQADGSKVRQEFGLGVSPVIGCVGRLFRNKGHSYLLDALVAVAVEVPGVKLLVVGGGDRAELEAMVDAKKLNGYVIFTGHRSDVPACMAAMDVLAHPSLSESFGQVIVEAMGVGTPVVATNVGGVPEIVENEVTGLLVEPADPNALAASILRLLRDDELRRRLASKAQAAARERFGVEKMIERHWIAYRELLEMN